MVKVETRCPFCGGLVTVTRDLEDELGAAEVEALHAPGCCAARPDLEVQADRELSDPSTGQGGPRP